LEPSCQTWAKHTINDNDQGTREMKAGQTLTPRAARLSTAYCGALSLSRRSTMKAAARRTRTSTSRSHEPSTPPCGDGRRAAKVPTWSGCSGPDQPVWNVSVLV